MADIIPIIKKDPKNIVSPKMRLLGWPTSPFVAKVRACIAALGIEEYVIFECHYPLMEDDRFRTFTPLSKIPALVLEGGDTLYDSPVICEYLDYITPRLHGDRQGTLDNLSPTLIPMEHRFWMLKVQALCDGIMEAVVQYRYEVFLRPKHLQSMDWAAHLLQGCTAGLDDMGATFLDKARPLNLHENFNLATLSACACLAYIALRMPDQLKVLEHSRPDLLSWHANFLTQYPHIKEVLSQDNIPLPHDVFTINA